MSSNNAGTPVPDNDPYSVSPLDTDDLPSEQTSSNPVVERG